MGCGRPLLGSEHRSMPVASRRSRILAQWVTIQRIVSSRGLQIQKLRKNKRILVGCGVGCLLFRAFICLKRIL